MKISDSLSTPTPTHQQAAPIDDEDNRTFIQKYWKIGVPVIILVIVALIVWQAVSSHNASQNEARVKALKDTSQTAQSGTSKETADGLDTLLMDQQPSLREKYGTPKEGFIWDVDGTLLSLGDASMAPDEVVYTYLRALNTLDFSTAEWVSRRASVVTSYSDYFDRNTSDTVDYKDQFFRDTYKQALLSLQVTSVDRAANFSANKQVYTVKGKMLDFTNKEFWLKDRDTIMNKLHSFSKSEGDKTKAELYLYQYVTKAYQDTIDAQQQGIESQSGVPMRDVTFDITVQRYPAQNSGWLVSIDKDLDLLCKYTDGNNIVTYIMDEYKDQLY